MAIYVIQYRKFGVDKIMTAKAPSATFIKLFAWGYGIYRKDIKRISTANDYMNEILKGVM